MSDPLILCCGEAVLDMVPATLVGGGAGFRPVPGGGALNCAVALARQGVAAGFVGALSSDPAGARLAAHMQAEGVSLELATRTDHPCPLALAQPIAGGTRFDLYDSGSAGALYAASDLPDPLPDSTRALVFGGISLIASPAAEAFETLARRGADTRLIWLDLNIRPGLVRAPERYRARLMRMAALADVVKVSDEDLCWLGPGALDDLRRLAPLVLHTRGEDGATAHWATQSLTLPAPRVQAVDTVGAGDIFNAAVLADLARSGLLAKPLDLPEPTLRAALAHGIRCASDSVTRPGADAPKEKETPCAP
ncbi:carbohydrate kinase family protein [Antarcticimicrobium sediminis]|uniref:Carbohydrate kinase n=1 Tax=Antarcticimicrobium sediminis TaxID=2546227 RepID=A0A4R5EQ22_9RHOB|nr:carbohydrate kinase [Antarcticimicrobium sediminis]TDE36757.1 carbohydrate kinase [Antarcticimicrobium sediminis]